MENELYKRLTGKYAHLSNEDLLQHYRETIESAKRQTSPKDVMFYDEEISQLEQEISRRGLTK